MLYVRPRSFSCFTSEDCGECCAPHSPFTYLSMRGGLKACPTCRRRRFLSFLCLCLLSTLTTSGCLRNKLAVLFDSRQVDLLLRLGLTLSSRDVSLGLFRDVWIALDKLLSEFRNNSWFDKAHSQALLFQLLLNIELSQPSSLHSDLATCTLSRLNATCPANLASVHVSKSLLCHFSSSRCPFVVVGNTRPGNLALSSVEQGLETKGKCLIIHLDRECTGFDFDCILRFDDLNHHALAFRAFQWLRYLYFNHGCDCPSLPTS